VKRPGQALSDSCVAPFSYITHASMQALQNYFEQAEEAKLSTGLALYMGIAYLLSAEKRDGRHEGAIEKTRGQIGEAGGLSPTNVTRYSEHLVSAGVLELEQLVAGGANIYRWKLVEPPFEAPHQIGEAGGSPLQGGETPHQGGETPHQGGETPHQIGEAYIEEEGTKKTTEETPCSPPSGDSDVVRHIFDSWLRLTERSSSTKFTEKRQRKIRFWLKEDWPPEKLLRAIAGCAGSDWHMKRGRWANREGSRRTELTMILDSVESIEDFIDRPPVLGWVNAAPIASDIVESEKAMAAWGAAKEFLAKQLPDSTFKIWLEPLECAGERDGKLVLVDPSGGGLGVWVSRRYRALILEVTDGFDDLEFIDEKQLELEAA
jgi:hypothetical protein